MTRPHGDMQPPYGRKLHLGLIDGLRALAVLSVMAFHFFPRILPGGFLGVDLFFVISGFVVSLSLAHAPGVGGMRLRAIILAFYARRAARILPALYLCLLITTLIGILIVPSTWAGASIEPAGRAALLGLSNFVLARSAGDYFAPNSEFNLFTHTWSLGVEEQFYLLFPWLFTPFLRGRAAWPRRLFAGGAIASLLAAAWLSHAAPAAAFYLIISRFWELGLGVLAFLHPLPHAPAPKARRAAAWICTAAIAAALLLTSPGRTPFPGGILPCVATACLLMLARAGDVPAPLQQILTSAPAAYFGRISYSLYLWHWPVVCALRWSCGVQPPLHAICGVLISVGLAHLSYRFVEIPPRAWLARRTGRAPAVLAMALLAVAVLYPTMRNLWPLRSVMSLSNVMRHRDDWYPDRYSKGIDAQGCRLDVLRDEAAGVTRFTRGLCPAAVAAPRLAVIGDSHALAYHGLIAAFVRQTGSPAVVYDQAGCPVLGPAPTVPDICARFLSRAVAAARTDLHAGDTLFLPGLRLLRLVDQFDDPAPTSLARVMASMQAQAPWRAESLQASIAALRPLAAAGVRIIIEAPKPVFMVANFRCADWYSRANPVCAQAGQIDRAVIERLRAPVMAQIAALQRAVPGLLLFDPLPLLCPGSVCQAYDAGRPLFFDADHLSAYGNRKLLPAFLDLATARQ